MKFTFFPFALAFCLTSSLLQAQITYATNWSETRNTHTVGAGSDRLLLYVVTYESNPPTRMREVTYGGQPMTELMTERNGFNHAGVWYLDEAGIVAASGDAFVPTFSDGTPNGLDDFYYTYTATLAGVDQSNPIVESSFGVVSNSDFVTIGDSLSVVAGGLAFYAVSSGQNNSRFTPSVGFDEIFENSQDEGAFQSSTLAQLNPTTDGQIRPRAQVTNQTVNRLILTTVSFRPVDASLPVELTTFRAIPSPAGVRLRWTTEREQYNDYFSVERSPDGRRWTQVTTVPGSGTTTDAMEYGYLDRQAPVASMLYYRLRQTDFDGTTSLSEVVACDGRTGSLQAAVYPNPTTGRVLINAALPSFESGRVRVFDLLGHELTDGVKISSVGFGTSVDLSGQPNGLYLITVGERTYPVRVGSRL